MTIIEVDGVNHEPLVVDEIQIFAGQRYSFVLTADQAIDNYWLRAVPNKGTTGFDGGINSAILRYDGAAAIEPTTNQTTSVLALNETDLVPVDDVTPPGTAEVGGVDYALNLVTSFVSPLPLDMSARLILCAHRTATSPSTASSTPHPRSPSCSSS